VTERVHGGLDMGTDTIFDGLRTGGERSTCNVQLSTFNGVTERAHGGLDMGTDTIFDGLRTGGERSTCNVQLSTFNGVTERAHGGLDMGTDTIFESGSGMAMPGSRFGRPRAANGGVRLVIEWRCQARYLVRSKREKGTDTLFGEGEHSTLNAQSSTSGTGWAAVRDRMAVPGSLFGRPRAANGGARLVIWFARKGERGQARCLGRGNVQRVTFNSQHSMG